MIRRPVVIAGARPNFPKVAPLMRALAGEGVPARLVHTGQHYDAAMSASFFECLDIPEPAANLGVGSGSHATQTAAVMVAIETWLESADADALLVVGDVNSTVACALVAAKAGIPVGHVEAGLRSFDRSMPEEINRVMVDALATWLFTPSADGDENLRAEGVEPERIHLVGNVMVDSLYYALPEARRRSTVADLGLTREGFGLVTLHRPALVDHPDRLADVARTLSEIGKRLPLVFPVHPRTRQMLQRCDIPLDPRRVQIVEPLGYLDFLALEEAAALVLTDSGGVQEETSVLGVPCLTLRDNTERPVTVTRGTNRLVGFDRGTIVSAAHAALARGRRPADIPLWDGQACQRIAQVLTRGAPAPQFVPPALAAHGSEEFRAGRARIPSRPGEE
ncbi:MAG TPA: UDP-N-acetylglucosamine 2-epimerase (non-hydrolyzing) [Candidatus Binatia bacterium]|nr:UDP-N-acetylglucosamine 2-epimerase (non-hydrolyzing) [Candidatus Binatia bacterium]